MIILCDFDGVLCRRNGIPRKESFMKDKPVSYAVEAIEFLQKKGHEVFVFTARAESEWGDVRKWLTRNKFPFMTITNVKQKGTKMIIDDRAVRFTNWMDVCKLFG